MHERLHDDSIELGLRLWGGRDIMGLDEEGRVRMASAIEKYGELQIWTHTHYDYVEPDERANYDFPPAVIDTIDHYFAGLHPWMARQKAENRPILALIEYEQLAKYARYYGFMPGAFPNLWYCATFTAEATPMHTFLYKQEYWALKQIVNTGRALHRGDEEILLRHVKEGKSDWEDVDTVLLEELFYMEQDHVQENWDALVAQLCAVGATHVEILGSNYQEVPPLTDTDMRFVSLYPRRAPTKVPHGCAGQTCKELAIRKIGVQLVDNLLIPQRPSREVKEYLEYLSRARPF